MKKIIGVIACGLFLNAAAASSQVTDKEKVQMEKRIEKLIKKMTLEEKVGLLHGNSKFYVAGVERLGIPEWSLSDGPHGVRAEINRHDWAYAGWTNESASYFPTGTAFAAAWNPELAYRRGEVLGIAAIEGNGQSELIYGITGLEKPTSGTIRLEGRDITNAPIRERSKAGMSHIPEDRHKHGLVLDYTLADNMVLQRYWQPEFQNHGFIKKNAVLQYAERLIKQYDVRSGQGPATIARSMSGGNQQKAIIAREVDKDPQLLVAVQPTRGLDVCAIEYIHKQIVAERDKGRAVLLVSLELDEVMNLSDRILVIYEGEIVGEFDPKKTTVEELGLYMAGAKKQGEAKA